MEKKKIDIKGIIKRFIISLLIVIVICLAFYLIFRKLGYTKLSVEQIRDMISKTGVWGPLVFIILSFLQVTFIPIPSTVTILGGNLLFGPWLSLLYSFIGIFLGSLFAFFLGRKLGKKFVYWIVGDKDMVEEYLTKSKGKEFVVLFFMFLLPMFPDDALCLIAGITSIKYGEFIFMQCISRPIAILGTLFFMSGEIIPFNAWGISIIVVVAILSIVAFTICYKNADKITSSINNFFEKLKFKRKNKQEEKQ